MCCIMQKLVNYINQSIFIPPQTKILATAMHGLLDYKVTILSGSGVYLTVFKNHWLFQANVINFMTQQIYWY